MTPLRLDNLRELIGPAAESAGYELVDLEWVTELGRQVLRLFIDKSGGVSHEDCEIVSREVSALLTHAVRSVDVVARYGGEEFVVVLPETGEEGAVVFAERIRERIAEQSFGVSEGVRLPITASIGVATFPAPAVDSVDDLFASADAALYRAKAEGRNRVKT